MPFWSKKTAPPTVVEQAVSRPKPPGKHVIPEGANVNDYRDGYLGTIYGTDAGCGICKGDGFVPKDGTGPLVICSCRRADERMLTKNDHLAQDVT